MNLRRLFNWFFYGHVWIALAATGLSWLSIRLSFGLQETVNEVPVLLFVFFATLGIYTIHRYLSWRRAGARPTARRYEIVANHSNASLLVGGSSLVFAGLIGLTFIGAIWDSLIWALPITIFYLTPPVKGWRRLRDISYLKNIWVAWAWTIMTHTLPVAVIGNLMEAFYIQNPTGLPNCFGYPWDVGGYYAPEIIIRFAFIFCIALLFDLRDIKLDRSQNVITIANSHPVAHRVLVGLSLTCCAYLTFTNGSYLFLPDYFSRSLSAIYLLIVPVAFITYQKTSENWYAVVVNGLLLVPPIIFLAMLFWMGDDAGAWWGLDTFLRPQG